ncbi:MAG: hypothetical protein NTW21_07735 [Verrucomicrobia bacterium]|nr:hypothetical protein [Verrucomicrobiota bacterium]
MEIPDARAGELVRRMGNPALAAVEALACRAYDRGVFSLEQVRLLLGLESRWQAQAVLRANGVWPGTMVADLSAHMAAAGTPEAAASAGELVVVVGRWLDAALALPTAVRPDLVHPFPLTRGAGICDSWRV